MTTTSGLTTWNYSGTRGFLEKKGAQEKGARPSDRFWIRYGINFPPHGSRGIFIGATEAELVAEGGLAIAQDSAREFARDINP